MVQLVEILFLLPLGILILHLFVITLLAFGAKVPRPITGPRKRRFAVVVPAHNEEKVLGRTLASMDAIEYPREFYDVVVVADNCSDATVQVASRSGAIVLERVDPALRGKGHALRWCFDRLLAAGKQYDAFVVVDADSVVSQNILSVFDHYLSQGKKALQASDLIAPQPGVWNIEAVRLAFFLHNYVRPLGRSVFRGHVGAMGNGMCFVREAFDTVPWNAYSQGEDLEYGLNLLLKGITMEFAPEALVLASMPSNPKHAESQRSRWEMSRFPLIRRFVLPLLRAAWSQRSLKMLDALMELITPAYVNLVALVTAGLIVNTSLAVAGVVSEVYALLWGALTLLALLHLVLGLLIARDRSLTNTVLYVPKYAFWKILLYLKLLRRGHSGEWIRTSRES